MSVQFDSYFPFDTGSGATATPANWRSMARLFNGSGVVWGNQSNFNASISGGILTIQPGAVWVDGFYGQTNGNKSVSSVGLGAGTVVARMDLGQRQVYFLYLSDPTAPGQNPAANTYDVPLYHVTSPTAFTDIRQYLYTSVFPCARMNASAQTIVGDGTWTQVALTSAFTKAGMTYASNAITLPTNGIYRVSGQVFYEINNGLCPPGRYAMGIRVGPTPSSALTVIQSEDTNGSGNFYPAPTGSVLCQANAKDTVTLWAWKGNGNVNVGTYPATWLTSLSVELVSQ